MEDLLLYWIVVLLAPAAVVHWFVYLGTLARFRISSSRLVETKARIKRSALVPVHTAGLGSKALDKRLLSPDRQTNIYALYEYTYEGRRYTSDTVIPGERFSVLRSNGDPDVAARIRTAEKTDGKEILVFIDPQRPYRAFLTNRAPTRGVAVAVFLITLASVGFWLYFTFERQYNDSDGWLVLGALPVMVPALLFLNSWLHTRHFREDQDL